MKMKIKKKIDGTMCFFRHTQGNHTGKWVSVAVNLEKEEDRNQFIPLVLRLLEYPEFVEALNLKGYILESVEDEEEDQE